MANRFNNNNNDDDDAKYTLTCEGGRAFFKSDLEMWFETALSSRLSDTFYYAPYLCNDRASLNRLTDIIAKTYGYDFVAKAAIFARNEIGNRSASQIIAAYLNDKQFDGKRRFYTDFCHRPDDVTEIMSIVSPKSMSHAMKNGFKDYLESLGPYSIGKYHMSKKDVSMYDAINLTHAHSDTIDKFKNGMLEKPDTWEQKISGLHDVNSRRYEWVRLLNDGSLGYIAIIRNINKIMDAIENSEYNFSLMLSKLCDAIESKNAIHKSLVTPYQIYLAYIMLKPKYASMLRYSFEHAFIVSTDNMPHLDGKNAMLVDLSFSMDNSLSNHSVMTIKMASVCYAVALSIRNDVDIAVFATYSKMVKMNRKVSPFDRIDSLLKTNVGCMTNIYPAMNLLAGTNNNYDRVFIFSDMQTFDDISDVRKIFPYQQIYTFDLDNYSSTCVDDKDGRYHNLTALSDKVFGMIPLFEDGEKLYSQINSIEL